MKKLLPIIFCLFFSSAPWAQQGPVGHASLYSEASFVQAGKPFWLAIELKLPEHWHTYAQNPGDIGYPVSFKWSLPKGATVNALVWPKPKTFTVPPFTGLGYDGDIYFLAKITPSDRPTSEKNFKLGLTLDWLSCSDVCIPEKQHLSLSLPISGSAIPNPDWPAVFKRASGISDMPERMPQKSLWLMLGIAFIGGLILNAMPCVFPVLSLKILGFVRQAGEDKHKIWRHGCVFTLGILISFWALSALLLGLRAAGNQLGWGFQLQSPAFVVAMSMLFFVLGLNLLGVFEIGASAGRLGQLLVGKTGYASSFWNGVLVTVVATPCSVPFMGTALGFALSQNIFRAFLVFTALAIGLASPYLLFARFPKLLAWLPKPGAWMLVLRQALAFPLFATVIWLTWVLSLQAGSSAVAELWASLLSLGLVVWLMSFRPRGAKIAAIILAALTLAFAFRAIPSQKASLAASEPAPNAIRWQPFSNEKLNMLRAEGKAVFIDFTAAWCLTCQVNDRAAFHSAEVADTFRRLAIVALKADWTNRDEEISKTLNAFGRLGVPFYVFYPAGSDTPIILPEVLTPKIVLENIEKKSP